MAYNGHLTAAQTKYNKYHSSTRMVIERAFGHVKGCFRRLKYLDVEVKNVPLIVMAVCILHNLCIIHEDDIEDFIEGVEEEVNGLINIFPPRAGGERSATRLWTDCINYATDFLFIDKYVIIFETSVV